MAIADESGKKLHAQLTEAFRDWDKNKAGVICADHLKAILRKLEPSFSEPELAKLLEVFDSTKSGMIEYEEFLDFLFSDLAAASQPPAAIVMWGYDSIVKTYRISMRQQVVQVLVGPYTAFMLLSDGNCCRIGPTSCDDEEPLAAPQPLPAIRKSVGGPISRLGIDYMTLYAICADSQEVWLEDRPGEDTVCGVGAAHLLMEEKAEEGEETDPEEDPEERMKSSLRRTPSAHTRNKMKSLFDAEEGPQRATQICGRGVVDLLGDQLWGIAASSSVGKSMLYAGAHARSPDVLGRFLEVPNPSAAGESILWADSQDGPQKFLVELDVGAGSSPVRKIAIVSCAEGALLLLEDGSVAALGTLAGAPARLVEGRLAVPLLPELTCIVDISADGTVLLDRAGLLWRLMGRGRASQLPIVGAEKVDRLCGDVAVVAAGDGCEDAYALGSTAAATWATGLTSMSYANSGRLFGVCHVAGATPAIAAITGLCVAEEQADAHVSAGANTLARICGRPMLPEEGCDIGRLESLLADGCSPNSIVPESGCPLLFHFAERAADQEAGMAEAAATLVKRGADHAEAVHIATGNGDAATLKALRSAGCDVSDAAIAKCLETAT